MPGDNTGSSAIRIKRELYRSGHSTVLTIPPDVLDALEWGQGDKVLLEADTDTLRVWREDVDA